jgi:rubrerythrin
MTMTTSRGEFLTAGMRGGLALVAGGSLLAVTAGTAAAKDTGDVAIAKLAATAELLAIDFYGRAIQRGGFTGDVLAYMEAARQNERDHYAALAAVIGSGAPKGVRFKYAAGTFASPASIAKTGVAAETAFVGAYLGAVKAFQDNDLKAAAGQIGANEAQHLTVLKRLAAGGTLVPNPSFPKSITAAQALAAVKPFIAS